MSRHKLNNYELLFPYMSAYKMKRKPSWKRKFNTCILRKIKSEGHVRRFLFCTPAYTSMKVKKYYGFCPRIPVARKVETDQLIGQE